MPTALFYNVFSQVSLSESRAFCPKNYIVSAAGGAAAPPSPPPYAYAAAYGRCFVQSFCTNDKEATIFERIFMIEYFIFELGCIKMLHLKCPGLNAPFFFH